MKQVGRIPAIVVTGQPNPVTTKQWMWGFNLHIRHLRNVREDTVEIKGMTSHMNLVRGPNKM